MSRVALAPIYATDLQRVGEFLHRNLNERISSADWARGAHVPWNVDAPNHGFMLLDGDEIAGVYLAFYSARTIRGRTEKICNLGAWCVLSGYRLHSIRLLNAILNQSGYHFTDLSPSGNTIAVNERLKFVRLDTTTAIMPNFPWPLIPGSCDIITDPADIERMLAPDQRAIYLDHREARAACHVVLRRGDDTCYVLYRRDRRKKLPLFASVLYVGNRPLFLKCTRYLGRHLLIRHGIPATLMELRIVGEQPAGSHLLSARRPKMYKSETLQPEEIDDLYSELVCIAW